MESNKDIPHLNEEKHYELDVDRMINEGLAGGTVDTVKNRKQIEEARDLPRQGQPFPVDD
ncbi:hypothetical protein [Virgibacillus senegalensis]|uniref:hypothetical protein n=1 Tax=Virgibacillus senegalensis TaxID=1499679 RepID=UPI00069EDCE7|nr:hypothetical protein [Virgibacillus senegalensis]